MKQQTLHPFLKETYKAKAKERIDLIWPLVEPVVREAYELIVRSREMSLSEIFAEFHTNYLKENMTDTQHKQRNKTNEERYNEQIEEDMLLLKNSLCEPGLFFFDYLKSETPIFNNNLENLQNLKKIYAFYSTIPPQIFSIVPGQIESVGETLSTLDSEPEYNLKKVIKVLQGYTQAPLSIVMFLGAQANDTLIKLRRFLLKVVQKFGWDYESEKFFREEKPNFLTIKQKISKYETKRLPVRADWTLHAYEDFEEIKRLQKSIDTLEARMSAIQEEINYQSSVESPRTIKKILNYLRKRDITKFNTQERIEAALSAVSELSAVKDNVREDLESYFSEELKVAKRISKLESIKTNLQEKTEEFSLAVLQYHAPDYVEITVPSLENDLNRIRKGKELAGTHQVKLTNSFHTLEAVVDNS